MIPLDAATVPLDGTQLIEASAGTGKTHTLGTLFLRLLLERQLGVGEVLVVTYTNAATAELQTRLRSRLLEARVRASGDELRCLNAALYGLDDAAVFTIHGFCQRVLQDHAFESGVSFDAELLTDQRSLVREIVRDFWVNELHRAPAAFVRHVSDNKKRLEDLTALALRAAALRDVPILPHREDPAASGDDDDARLLRLRVDLAHHARAELQRRKTAQNVQYFDDLLTRLHDALKGPGGEALAAEIRRRYRAALIDEFQDTDPTQYEIFRRIFGRDGAPLFLIGDPKQSIYGFRGADVFTYVAAKRDAGTRVGTLTTNHRSDPRLIEAVNTLFQRAANPFLMEGISFTRSTPKEEAREHVGGALAGHAPLQILFARNAAAMHKPVARTHVHTAVANEIARLLAAGATIDDEPLRPHHIAVLCRTNDQAAGVQRALRRLRIQSVLRTDQSVLKTPEADEVLRVVRGLAEPSDTGALLAALSTPLIGAGATELHGLADHPEVWDLWTGRFHRWHQVWVDVGFTPAYRGLIAECGAAERILPEPDGERRMTNFLHLGEILENAAAEGRRGPLALAQWFTDVCSDDEHTVDALADAAQIRLESDDFAVSLATVHKAKGLEYRVVFCPFLWSDLLLFGRDKDDVRFHDDEGNLALDLGSDEQKVHCERAMREAFAENLRLLYVALTRARHRCVVIWGLFKGVDRSALGLLLHGARLPTEDPIAAMKTLFASLSDDHMIADLRRVEEESGGSIEAVELRDGDGPVYRREDRLGIAAHCRAAERTLRLDWRTSSFSALIAGGERMSGEAEEGVDRDEGSGGTALVEREAREAEAVRLAAFPAGTRAGHLIHSIFETLDFTAGEEVLREVVADRLVAFGFESTWRDDLARAVADVLLTPLDVHPEGEQLDLLDPPHRDRFCLAEIPHTARLNELEFLFPVSGPEGAASFHSGRLAEVFTRRARSVTGLYIERLRQLGFAPLSGFLKGYVDMAFAHDGRWYVVDYKSNHLGPHPSSYRRPALERAMEQHHYMLQYHLYAVAMHRYLGRRLRGYDYDSHFGGVYYLFVRGMAPSYASANGIFFDRPPRALVEDLSQALERP